MDTIMVTLGYTDDPALLNRGDENGIEAKLTSQSAKLKSIAITSHTHAMYPDMCIRIHH